MKNSLWLALVIVTGLAALFLTKILINNDDKQPSFSLSSFTEKVVQHPSDSIEFKQHIWVTELKNARVVKLESNQQHAQEGALAASAPPISSPHFFAKTDLDLFVSAGWGKDIYRLSDEPSATFTKVDFSPLTLNAPHGLCVKDGWLYVADSLNSRIVRKHIGNDKPVEIFTDTAKKISYGRQLRCDQRGVWIVNSYERRSGLNPGRGSNVLLIQDFESGNVEIIREFPKSNATGMEIINDRFLVVGLWQANRIDVSDLNSPEDVSDSAKVINIKLPEPYAGPPYGMRYNEQTSTLVVAFIGDLYKPNNYGGLANYSVSFTSKTKP